MQTVILAAGRGTRMKSLTVSVPKPMLEIRGVPLLDHKIRSLPDECGEIILVVGHNRNAIENYFGSAFDGRNIAYAVQQELNGSFGALATAQPMLKDRFLVLMGDDLYHPSDYQRLMRFDLSILIQKITRPITTGVLQLDAYGHLTNVLEHQKARPGQYVNCGAYALTTDIFSAEPVQLPNGEFGLPQTLAMLAADHEIHTVEATDWFPITTPDDLRVAEENLSSFLTG